MAYRAKQFQSDEAVAMIDPVADAKEKAVALMQKHLQAKARGDYAKADEFYAESLFCIRLLKDAGEDVERIR
jgi:hypothetical protein